MTLDNNNQQGGLGEPHAGAAGSTPAPPLIKNNMARLKAKTELQKWREERNLSLFKEYNKLVSKEGQSRTEVIKFLMDKYNVHSTATIYTVIKQQKEQTV